MQGTRVAFAAGRLTGPGPSRSSVASEHRLSAGGRAARRTRAAISSRGAGRSRLLSIGLCPLDQRGRRSQPAACVEGEPFIRGAVSGGEKKPAPVGSSCRAPFGLLRRSRKSRKWTSMLLSEFVVSSATALNPSSFCKESLQRNKCRQPTREHEIVIWVVLDQSSLLLRYLHM